MSPNTKGNLVVFIVFASVQLDLFFAVFSVPLILLVLHLVLDRLLYFYRLMLFNEAIKLLELSIFKVDSLL